MFNPNKNHEHTIDCVKQFAENTINHDPNIIAYGLVDGIVDGLEFLAAVKGHENVGALLETLVRLHNGDDECREWDNAAHMAFTTYRELALL